MSDVDAVTRRMAEADLISGLVALTMRATGLRVSQVLGIRASDIDIAEATLRVRVGKSRQEKADQRLIVLPDWLVDSLREQVERCAPEGALFPTRNGRETSQTRAAWEAATEAGEVRRDVWDPPNRNKTRPNHAYRAGAMKVMELAQVPDRVIDHLVAHAGALDVFFAGWELIGVASVLYIGFFHERDEPVRSSLRAFASYRISDLGFMLGIVATHEWIGSTRLSALPKFAELPPHVAIGIAALFLFAALGKSAQLPFSGWLPRAMEGPTPSSALFYGGVSIHAGLFLLLRLRPVFEAAPIVAAVGVGLGIGTAVYATLVARVHPDAKGALAHATLGQVGLILAEISLGFEALALVHLVGHAALRLYQYLRAPNRMHDAHRLGHRESVSWLRHLPPFLQNRLYSAAVHRFRLDEWLDRSVAPVYTLARWLDSTDGRVRRAVSFDRNEP